MMVSRERMGKGGECVPFLRDRRPSLAAASLNSVWEFRVGVGNSPPLPSLLPSGVSDLHLDLPDALPFRFVGRMGRGSSAASNGRLWLGSTNLHSSLLFRHPEQGPQSAFPLLEQRFPAPRHWLQATHILSLPSASPFSLPPSPLSTRLA